ncbi:Ribosomal-protein-alanine acetyltransferase [Candidatus Profftia lariciata]|uniref:ribosomal protein S18-alanine N-acetyltransferase n=1 Tax=Candidatus Profftia lariciata TaxID=1987921 RepID=UPI001D004F86|nr:ribosomal protein S18-alanine N-acetyltransferase [Candidatus Profftia lariciata]UDG81509.1 Ribosomal-protein-alanine acetyltransferase [Candidatus Profftia lariciata]
MNKIVSINSKISLLQKTDFNNALKIECASYSFPWTKKILLSNYGKSYYNLKLEYNGILIAFLITQVILNEAILLNIVVESSKRRKGLGRKLLRTLIDELNNKNIITLWLEVRYSNNVAIALYESLGFNKVSVRYNYYPTKNGREHAHIMALTLV